MQTRISKTTVAITLFAVMLISLSLALVWIDIKWLGGSWKDWFHPTPVISLLGLVGGFGALLWQLEVQHLNLLESNRKQSQDNLKLDIYREIAARIEATSKSGEIILSQSTKSRVETEFRLVRSQTIDDVKNIPGKFDLFLVTEIRS